MNARDEVVWTLEQSGAGRMGMIFVGEQGYVEWHKSRSASIEVGTEVRVIVLTTHKSGGLTIYWSGEH